MIIGSIHFFHLKATPPFTPHCLLIPPFEPNAQKQIWQIQLSMIFSFILSSKFVRYYFNAEVEMSKTIIMDSERERCLCLFWILYCVFVVALWILCLCFRLCAHKQLVQWWQVEGSWRAEYPWLGPRPHRPPSSTDHRCPCLRISDWLWSQSCIGTSTNTHSM